MMTTTSRRTVVLPERLRELDVVVSATDTRTAAGQLLKHSIYEFRYLDTTDVEQPAVSLLMPPSRPTWRDGDLFPVMDQNLPEGELFMRLRELHPKQALTPMHLLALIGSNAIGRLAFRLPNTPAPGAGPVLERATLLATRYTPEVFNELVRAYLSTGAGISGMQPKIMVPTRASIPIPNLIVKAASAAYPGLAANEYLCSSAARRAGIEVPVFELSDDGQLLLIDRFDIADDGTRLGFEDVAALMGLRVRDVHADRKYQGSYEAIAQLLRLFGLAADDLRRLFEQVALSVMVRNGDAHLKNFGVLYTHIGDARLSPLFDVVTTSIYTYTRYPGGPELEDRTLALKLLVGKGRTRAYPTTQELLAFGHKVCGVTKPQAVIDRIAAAMHDTMVQARGDSRIPHDLRESMARAWETGMAHASASR
jgi:serine/threonine-protein kinase HipA